MRSHCGDIILCKISILVCGGWWDGVRMWTECETQSVCVKVTYPYSIVEEKRSIIVEEKCLFFFEFPVGFAQTSLLSVVQHFR